MSSEYLRSNFSKVNDLLKDEKYHCWCSECDDIFINDSMKGNLYRIMGHLYSYNYKELGNYEPVFFSYCRECDPFLSIKSKSD